MPDRDALVERARGCDDCLCWLDVCEAACCRHLSFRRTAVSDVEISDADVRIRILVTSDLVRYFELHGAVVEDDVLVLPRAACDVRSDRIWASMRCTELDDDLLCSLHPDGKPDCCAEFTLETARSGDYRVPSRCLYGYKLRD